mmetsp:Transcript_19888/g.24551  ORF Transcript_19888/g.24551 Transcript_19888/m.24551 type:complete len:213 (+) Transcript_19888:271-909(+)
MLYPTVVLHDSLHLGLFAMIFCSVNPAGFNKFIPFSTLTVHLFPQKSHFGAFGSSIIIRLFNKARWRFSPANNSTISLLSAPSAHCAGGYATSTITLGHLRIRLIPRMSSGFLSPGNCVSAAIVLSKSMHSQAAVRSTCSTLPALSVVDDITDTLAILSPGKIPAFSALLPSPTTVTIVIPKPSSRPPANSNSSNPKPPSLETTTSSTSSTK